jgi:hypothetical protein
MHDSRFWKGNCLFRRTVSLPCLPQPTDKPSDKVAAAGGLNVGLVRLATGLEDASSGVHIECCVIIL